MLFYGISKKLITTGGIIDKIYDFVKDKAGFDKNRATYTE